MKKPKSPPPKRPRLRVRSKGGKKRRRRSGGLPPPADGAGSFVGFARHCPEVAQQELRIITLSEAWNGVPTHRGVRPRRDVLRGQELRLPTGRAPRPAGRAGPEAPG